VKGHRRSFPGAACVEQASCPPALNVEALDLGQQLKHEFVCAAADECQCHVSVEPSRQSLFHVTDALYVAPVTV
jgi:hypothetical protein